MILTDGGGNPIGQATADGSGNWSFTPGTPLANGSVINAVAQDAAGNTSGPASTTVDSVAPSAPLLSISADGALLTGTAEPNSNQRYATNSETAGFFRHLCQDSEVPVQSFVTRSDMGCGSTIGPITASQVGVRTVDIGLPTFAMHSIRELAGSHDLAHLVKVLGAFYASSELP